MSSIAPDTVRSRSIESLIGSIKEMIGPIQSLTDSIVTTIVSIKDWRESDRYLIDPDQSAVSSIKS